MSKTTISANSERSDADQMYTELRKQRIELSPQFHQGRVINRMPHVPSPQKKHQFIWSYLGGRKQLQPHTALPYAAREQSDFSRRSDALKVTWLGHSTMWVEIDGISILTDPVFSYASPKVAKPWFERNVSTPIQREDLPVPKVVLISHDHYDHLEKTTIEYYRDTDTHFIVPLGVGKYLQRWGVKPTRIEELDWWQETQYQGVTLACTPANHNSGRYGWDSNSTLWASWVLMGKRERFYFSGDSAYDKHFAEIGLRYGPFDIAAIEVAADVKKDRGYCVENCGHMQASHTVRAALDLDAKKLLPIHWATFELFTHQWDEPINDLCRVALLQSQALLTPMIGETVHSQSANLKKWWLQPELQVRPVKRFRWRSPAMMKAGKV